MTEGDASTEPNASACLAAIDLGSNSFHMVVARPSGGQLKLLDRLREMTQLGAGLDAQDMLDEATRTRALACIGRFGERLRSLGARQVRAVGTNTLRRAHNADALLTSASLELGHPVEVISGREEARLIYRGVHHGMPPSGGHRLVVDIGGGSTECVLGIDGQPLLLDSLFMGCLSYTRRFFGDGRLTSTRFREASLAARVELQPLEQSYGEPSALEAVGSAGTIRTIAALIASLKLARSNSASGAAPDADHPDAGCITADSLEALREDLVAVGRIDKLRLPGVERRRAEVLPGGLAILEGVFESLGLERMKPAAGGLREGLLLELWGEEGGEGDVRVRTVAGMQQRFEVDVAQAARVERTALHCLAQVAEAWQLGERDRNQLLWAARLHEVGASLSHTGHHRHGAYVLEHSDMAGFTREGQRYLAALVGGHRRRFDAAQVQRLEKLAPGRGPRVCLLLRIAARLNRGRHAQHAPPVTLQALPGGVRLRFPKGWLAQHPLAHADLQQECEWLQHSGLKLRIDTKDG